MILKHKSRIWNVYRVLKCVFLISTVLIFKNVGVTQNRGISSIQQSGMSINNRHLLNLVEGYNCTPAAIHEFPSDGLTRDQRQQGWVLVYFLLTCYCFILLSIVCDDYFVPAIQKLVVSLQISEDVAGASFMAITSASPELFVNFVGTFITEGDIGVGTVVGSNVFNILAVPACCSIFANMTHALDWWSITRDCFVYAISVLLLIVTLYDDLVQWYEALAFVLTYILYLIIMYFNKPIHGTINKVAKKRKRKNEGKQIKAEEDQVIESLMEEENVNKNQSRDDYDLTKQNGAETCEDQFKEVRNGMLDESTEISKSIWEYPGSEPVYRQIWWILIWPIQFALKYSTPDCRKYTRLYGIALLMCMFWIGATSYLMSWFITVIGDTLRIPDSVTGLSFLAIGSSMPEIVSCIIISKQG